MTMRERHGLTALTEKEKQTLRLIVRGHDAKSVAQQLDLSVHTINERLRDARRKLSVSSSREAVRMLLDAEGGAIASPPPEYMGDRRIGEAPPQPMTARLRWMTPTTRITGGPDDADSRVYCGKGIRLCAE